jgi:hypothetical protein
MNLRKYVENDLMNTQLVPAVQIRDCTPRVRMVNGENVYIRTLTVQLPMKYNFNYVAEPLLMVHLKPEFRDFAEEIDFYRIIDKIEFYYVGRGRGSNLGTTADKLYTDQIHISCYENKLFPSLYVNTIVFPLPFDLLLKQNGYIYTNQELFAERQDDTAPDTFRIDVEFSDYSFNNFIDTAEIILTHSELKSFNLWRMSEESCAQIKNSPLYRYYHGKPKIDKCIVLAIDANITNGNDLFHSNTPRVRFGEIGMPKCLYIYLKNLKKEILHEEPWFHKCYIKNETDKTLLREYSYSLLIHYNKDKSLPKGVLTLPYVDGIDFMASYCGVTSLYLEFEGIDLPPDEKFVFSYSAKSPNALIIDKHPQLVLCK